MPITRGHFWATLEPLSSPSGEEVFWKDEWGTLGPTSSSPYLGSEHVHQAIGGSVEGEAPDQVDDEHAVGQQCREVHHLYAAEGTVSLLQRR